MYTYMQDNIEKVSDGGERRRCRRRRRIILMTHLIWSNRIIYYTYLSCQRSAVASKYYTPYMLSAAYGVFVD